MQYCGPGPAVIKTSLRVNGICKRHDWNYQKIIDQGLDPYTQWNWADELMLEQMNELVESGYDFTRNDLAVYSYIEGKRQTSLPQQIIRKLTNLYPQRKS
jgi:hypothetical protein